MSYTGFYINLDRSPKRRAAIEAQLTHHKLENIYRRFAAADGNVFNFPNPNLKAGEIGCFISHYKVLKENLDQTQPLHVIEDDVIFANCMGAVIAQVLESHALDHYDLIYTDTTIPTSNSYYKTYKNLFDRAVTLGADGRVAQAAFNVVDLQDKHFGSTSSFLVSPQATLKLHDLYEAELTRGATLPIDLFIRSLAVQNQIRVGCIFPFVTSIRLDDNVTTIEGRYDLLSKLALDVVRHSFFVDRDLDACRRVLRESLAMPQDPHLDILLQILGFSFTDRFTDI